MSYTNTKKMLIEARKNNYAIGAYNVFNLEGVKAVVNAAIKMNSPMIIQASESASEYAGMDNLVSIVKNEANKTTLPIALHLDHGKSVEACIKAIKAGFSSVMIDLSHLSYEDNVNGTKEVVKFAHKHGVTVEAELGVIKGTEDNQSSDSSSHTDPLLAIDFINKTKVDSLAVSIGTAHGVNKGTTNPTIRYDILEELEKLLPKDYPLVCHGASSVNNDIVEAYKSTGGQLDKAQGISLSDLKKLSTTTPISKINVDTDLRIVYTTALRKSLNEKPEIFDPRKHLKQTISTLEDQMIFMNTKVFR